MLRPKTKSIVEREPLHRGVDIHGVVHGCFLDFGNLNAWCSMRWCTATKQPVNCLECIANGDDVE